MREREANTLMLMEQLDAKGDNEDEKGCEAVVMELPEELEEEDEAEDRVDEFGKPYTAAGDHGDRDGSRSSNKQLRLIHHWLLTRSQGMETHHRHGACHALTSMEKAQYAQDIMVALGVARLVPVQADIKPPISTSVHTSPYLGFVISHSSLWLSQSHALFPLRVVGPF